MPQHQDQHDVILTEIGRQSGSTGVHVIHVQFLTDLVGTGVTATMQFKQTGNVDSGSETTTHLLTVKKSGTTLGSITWQRVVTLHDAADSTGGELLEPVVRVPADAGVDPAPLTTAATWSPTLESGPANVSDPTWTFALHLAHSQLVITQKVATKNVRRWMVEGKDGTTVVYRGYLTALISTSGMEVDPLDSVTLSGAKKSAKKSTKESAASWVAAPSSPGKKAVKKAAAKKSAPAKKSASAKVPAKKAAAKKARGK